MTTQQSKINNKIKERNRNRIKIHDMNIFLTGGEYGNDI